MQLEIVYQDDTLVAINKPHGLLVHRTKIAADATEFAVQRLRNQIEKRVYPVHRLDRKTSGVLLFATSAEANSYYQEQFRERLVKKKYLAIVRGHTLDSGRIEYPLTHENKTQEAITDYKTIGKFEIAVPLGKFSTSRYSLLELYPETGRFHQLRKHMAHIFHPIIGDRPHGCNKQNKLWKERFDMHTMLLHAASLTVYKEDAAEVKIEADCSPEFKRALEILRKSEKAILS